jgi:OFA family oxalate/formate antiporter-like MFS transporter
VLVSAVLFFAGFFISSRLQSLSHLYVGYGVLCGMASGFTYNAILSTIPGLFPKNSALVSGILLMAFGTSSLVMGMLFTAFTPSIIGAWRRSFLFMAFFMAAVFVVVFLLFPNTKTAPGKPVVPKGSTSSNECTTFAMLKRKNFYAFFFWLVFISAAGLALISQARQIALFVSPDTGSSVLSLIVGMIAVCNGLGRIIFGRLFDKAGNKRTMLIVNALLLLAGLVLLVAIQSGVFFILIAGFILLGIDYGGSPLVCAAYTRSAYGNKHFASNFSIANMNLLVASFSATISGMLFDAAGTYMSTMLFLILLGLAAMLLLFILNKVWRRA